MVVYDTQLGWDRNRAKECTVGIHPTEMNCQCVAVGEDNNCCHLFSCIKHRCGPFIDCRCPTPNRDALKPEPVTVA